MRVVDLAYHFHRAGAAADAARAADYAARAARRSLEALAFEDAAEHYERALEIVSRARPTDQRERCRLLLELGEALNRAGDTERARATLEEAAAVADDLGDP